MTKLNKKLEDLFRSVKFLKVNIEAATGKNMFLKVSNNFAEVCNFVKKDTRTQVFSCGFYKSF